MGRRSRGRHSRRRRRAARRGRPDPQSAGVAGLALGRPVNEPAERALRESEAAGYPPRHRAVVGVAGRRRAARREAGPRARPRRPGSRRGRLPRRCPRPPARRPRGLLDRAGPRRPRSGPDARHPIDLRHRLGDCRLGAPLEAAAQVAAARADWARALRVAGAAAVLRQRCGMPAASFERELLRRPTAPPRPSVQFPQQRPRPRVGRYRWRRRWPRRCVSGPAPISGARGSLH